MRFLKMFGLAAIGAVAAMAFVGASSAMAALEPLDAVVLCKLNVDPCPAGEDFPTGTVLHAELVSGTKAVLLSSLGTVECSTSTTSGKTTSLLAHGVLESLKFKNCKVGVTSCTVTEENLNYLVKGELNAAHNGYEALVTSSGSGAPQANVVCAGVVECKYGDNSVLLAAEPNASDTVLSVLQALGNSSGPLCGLAGPVWHAKYLTRCLDNAALVGCWLVME